MNFPIFLREAARSFAPTALAIGDCAPAVCAIFQILDSPLSPNHFVIHFHHFKTTGGCLWVSSAVAITMTHEPGVKSTGLNDEVTPVRFNTKLATYLALNNRVQEHFHFALSPSPKPSRLSFGTTWDMSGRISVRLLSSPFHHPMDSLR
jgi:hypothetical protein